MRQAGPRFSWEVDGVMTAIVIADWAGAGMRRSERLLSTSRAVISPTSASRFTARCCAWPARGEMNSSRSSLHLLNLAKRRRGSEDGMEEIQGTVNVFFIGGKINSARVLMTVQVSTWIMHCHYFQISTISANFCWGCKDVSTHHSHTGINTSVSLWSLL